MNFVQTLEECLRDLAAEARKKHPGVKEASERATLKLRSLQNQYVSQVRQASHAAARATGTSSSQTTTQHPTTRLFQSSEILHPFLLAANYPYASSRLLEISFRAMRLLIMGDAICPSDSIHMVRVWTIQAQVVVAYYQKQYAKEISHKTALSASAESSSSASSPATTTTTTTSSSQSSSTSSSWFGWGSSSSTTTTGAAAAAAASSTVETPSTSKSMNAVSSSSGQTGSSHQSPAQMEKMAKEILSCLLQLLELLRSNYPDHLCGNVELWTNAVALGCLWLHYLPARHTVHEAARSTVVQIVSLLYQTSSCSSSSSSNNNNNSKKLVVSTWKDLLTLSTGELLLSKNRPLSGAFCLCKTASATSPATAAVPPTPEFALELMTQVLKEQQQQQRSLNNLLLSDNNKLVSRTFGVTMNLLNQIPKTAATCSVEKSLRIVQWTLVVFSTYAQDYPIECRELFLLLIKPIVMATELCRSHHDFEDGYVYTTQQQNNVVVVHQPMSSDKGTTGAVSEKKRRTASSTSHHHHHPLTSLFPPSGLWKAGLSLEATHYILDRYEPNDEKLMLLFEDRSTMAMLAETLSDFATIGASCRDHMLQLVEFSESRPESGTEEFQRDKSAAPMKPTLFRKAEQTLASGNAASFTTLDSSSDHKKSSSCGAPSSILGEALWIALQGILRISDCMQSIEDAGPSLEETFAPSLAVLQHYLKRFIGSKDLIQLTLKGYSSLADVCIPVEGNSLHRKALLTSLCKLSLPSWGKQDESSQLQDHHVRSLLFLCRIIHIHYDSISTEWDIILRTFEELSVLAIASPLLSDETYHAALAVSAVFGRFAAFSTCFSTQSLLHFVEALTEISRSIMENRDVVGDSDTVLPQRTTTTDTPEKSSADDKETISGKILSMGVRAIYGGGTEDGKGEDLPATERTKNVYYEDYRRDFVERLSTSQSAVRYSSIGRIPFVLALLTDAIMANSFRLTECGDSFSEQLTSLAASSPVVRPFTMDVMSMLTMSHLSKDRAFPAPFVGPGRIVVADPMQSQLWAVETTGENLTSETVSKSQVELLAPICDTIRTTKQADVAESSLGALNSILEGVGHNLKGAAWSNVIDAVASLSGDPAYEVDRSSADWSGCCLMAFRCLKFIVDDFLDQLTSDVDSSTACRTSLLDCCSSFGSSRHDVNTSLTAIGLLWTIADQDSGTDSIDRALSKLVLLASDDRLEVRNASVNTLFSCIVGRGSSFSGERWESVFSDTIFGVYGLVTAKTRADNVVATEKSSSRYKVSLHHSRDSANKQWVATQVLVLRGLVRVLRLFFSQLLDTTDTGSQSDDIPWFQDAWVRMLDFAFEAASQNGERDTIDIRTVGVEMLVFCCQLSSKAGIQAATTPARVGTHMEVVNGALRSVRESQTTKASYERTHSMATELSRQSLFLEAFEGLESYKEFLVRNSNHEGTCDDTLLQILHKFGSGLSKLYDCCKTHEFRSVDRSRFLRLFESSESSGDMNADETALEVRFAHVVRSIIRAADGDSKSRFLNQAQRSALGLMRPMASDGSAEAFQQLIALAGGSFFVRREPDSDENEAFAVDDPSTTDLLSYEASTIVSEEVAKDSVSDECKALVLYKVLVIFSHEFEEDISKSKRDSRRRRYYKRIIPIVANGLESTARLDSRSNGSAKAVDMVWENFLSVLSQLLSPLPIGKDMMKLARISDLLEIIPVATDNVPAKYVSKLSTVLSFGASKAYELAKQHDAYSKANMESDMGKKSGQHRDELLKLFSLCFSGSCSLQPEDPLLRSIAKQALTDALDDVKQNGLSADADSSALSERIALQICRAIESNEKMETLVISTFSCLCGLVTSDNTSIRDAVGKVFASADVAQVLLAAQTRYESAERRADVAEKRVTELSSAVEDLQKKNQSLQREIAILEASAH